MSSKKNQSEHERLAKLETEVEILKSIVFGAVGAILLAVLGALVTLVLK